MSDMATQVSTTILDRRKTGEILAYSAVSEAGIKRWAANGG